MELAAFEEACRRDLGISQQELLESIVGDNSCSLYLQRYQVVDAQSFKDKVPIVDYQDIQEDIEQVFNGSLSSGILCKEPIRFLASSSGTTSTGGFKLLPHTQKSFSAFSKTQKVSKENKARFYEAPSGLFFVHAGMQLETNAGIKVAWVTTLLWRNTPYSNQQFTSPLEVVLAPHEESVYCHWLCALLQQDRVHFVSHFFATQLINSVKFLEREWKDICNDIRTGTLNPKIEDQQARDAVTKLLRADPGLADFVSGVCCQSSWSGIFPKLFPAAKYVAAVVTGSMRPYLPTLENYAGGLKIVAGDYNASEGPFGINMDVGKPARDTTFVLAHTDKFLEFLPYPQSSDHVLNSELVQLSELSVGKLYEIVVTTFGGLYRYRLGDVVKVVGYFYNCPCVAFNHRAKATLTVSWERTDEDELQSVVTETMGKCSIELVDFTGTTDFSVVPGRYVIYCELKNSEDYARHQLLKKCSKILDASFNECYRNERGRGVIGPLLLCTVRQKTFKSVMELAFKNGASPVQYKTPRCVNRPEMLQALRDNQVGEY